MKIAYSRLFESLNIGKVNIKNRIAMAPMGIIGLTNPDGNPAQRAIDYYIERARGGVGLIITSVFKVENEIDANLGSMHLINHASVAPFAELCEAVHALGARVFVQLTAGFGRVAPPTILRIGPVSASANPNYHAPSLTCRPLETSEVERLVEFFGSAAAILAAAGVVGIELHGHEGYLLDQFTTSIWNRREDKYGGDLKGRLTFPTEILRMIKDRAGSDFPVQYRFGLKHYIKGLNSGMLPGECCQEAGRDIEEGIAMARLLEAAGFDSLHVDAGCYDSWYWAHPPVYQEHGCMVDMAARAKQAVNIPVVAVGRLDIPEVAEKVIIEGKADIIALGRALLADPHWPIKAAGGKPDDIRPCIGCHEGCIGRFMRGRPLSCAVNPACGREINYQLNRTGKPKRVMIAGGGAAGMEAARVAATRGHQVSLYEKGKSLGGHLIEASVPDFKEDLAALLKWYQKQLQDLAVEVKLETEVTESLISRENPDAVIIATGSNPAVPDIPGIRNPNVCTCIDLLLGEKKTGKSAVIIGGGLVGCETALWLAKTGTEVTIIEMLPELISGGIPEPEMNRRMLLDLLSLHKVKSITGAALREVTGEGAIVTSVSGEQQIIKAETVVLALGLKTADELYQTLNGKLAHLYASGDCRSPRNIMEAIWDGYEVGRAI